MSFRKARFDRPFTVQLPTRARQRTRGLWCRVHKRRSLLPVEAPGLTQRSMTSGGGQYVQDRVWCRVAAREFDQATVWLVELGCSRYAGLPAHCRGRGRHHATSAEYDATSPYLTGAASVAPSPSLGACSGFSRCRIGIRCSSEASEES